MVTFSKYRLPAESIPNNFPTALGMKTILTVMFSRYFWQCQKADILLGLYSSTPIKAILCKGLEDIMDCVFLHWRKDIKFSLNASVLVMSLGWYSLLGYSHLSILVLTYSILQCWSTLKKKIAYVHLESITFQALYLKYMEWIFLCAHTYSYIEYRGSLALLHRERLAGWTPSLSTLTIIS